ncbi:MAG TPA: hypothetical protein VJ372_16470 [Pyrinomonadaceae bacterium]|nr:hypothetical protein [Pyrinomonadaceae bacterium]
MKQRELSGVPKSPAINETPAITTVKTCRLLGRIYDLEAVLVDLESFNFESKVDRAIPSLAAEPEGPKTRPPHSVRAASIVFSPQREPFAEAHASLLGFPRCITNFTWLRRPHPFEERVHL